MFTAYRVALHALRALVAQLALRASRALRSLCAFRSLLALHTLHALRWVETGLKMISDSDNLVSTRSLFISVLLTSKQVFLIYSEIYIKYVSYFIFFQKVNLVHIYNV